LSTFCDFLLFKKSVLNRKETRSYLDDGLEAGNIPTKGRDGEALFLLDGGQDTRLLAISTRSLVGTVTGNIDLVSLVVEDMRTHAGHEQETRALILAVVVAVVVVVVTFIIPHGLDGQMADGLCKWSFSNPF